MAQIHGAVEGNGNGSRLGGLTLAALGVVYGDIGTSPLYAFKETFGHLSGLTVNEANVLAVLSMMFWSIMVIVSIKYITLMLRFDNEGEGGILALLALGTRLTRKMPRLSWTIGVCGIFGASLFFGDAVITPAISVLSAVEGMTVSAPAMERWVIPVTVGILLGLFFIQKQGTGFVGRFFGPVMVIWFLTLSLLGVHSIVQTPEILAALDPSHALRFCLQSPGIAFLMLGTVFLCITGGEALYADMGHFGKSPIRIAWFALVFPALILNYLGQGALVLRDAEAVRNPFFLLASTDLQIALVVLATMATVIASQATISGAFSVARLATRLGYLPRLPTRHTSDTEEGQIYIPQLNWLMLVLVLLVVFAFRSSSAIATAYGISVSGTMLLDSLLVGVLLWSLPGRRNPLLFGGIVVIGMLEMMFFLANSTKFFDGGWFPLAIGLVVFTALTTWKRAQTVLAISERSRRLPLASFKQLFGPDIPRVHGTAVYLSSDPEAIPTTLMHNLKHNKVLHERMIFLHIADADSPRIPDADRVEVEVIEPHKVYRVTLRYGFMEEPDVPRGLALAAKHAVRVEPMETTFFLGRTTIATAQKRGLFTWRRELFRFMQRNSPSAAEYFRLSPERVIELGTRVSL
jgi:KUP system potassium uptake protein